MYVKRALFAGLIFVIMTVCFAGEAEEVVFSEHNGVCIYRAGTKYGLCLADKSKLCDAVYDGIEPFICDASVALTDGFKVLIDISGKTVSGPFDDLRYSGSNNLFIFSDQGEEGLINERGSKVSSDRYDIIAGYYNGYSICIRNDCVGVIDANGKEIVPCIYESAVWEDNDLIALSYFEDQYDDDFDAAEEEAEPTEYAMYYNVITDQYSQKFDFCYPFSNGYGLARIQDKDYIIDLAFQCRPVSNNIVIQHDMFQDGLVAIRKDGKQGYMGTSGEIEIPCIYDRAFSFYDGCAVVQKGSKQGVIGVTGEEIISCEYEKVTNLGKNWFALETGDRFQISNPGKGVLLDADINAQYCLVQREIPLLMKETEVTEEDEWSIMFSVMDAAGNTLFEGNCFDVLQNSENLIEAWLDEDGNEKVWFDLHGNIISELNMEESDNE